ncbi:hypothetical protein BH10BAC5_BH10BAC5_02140 [soil metagenome]
MEGKKELQELTFQCRSGTWYIFKIYPINKPFPECAGIYIFVQKSKGESSLEKFKIENNSLESFKFLHVGIDNDLSSLNDLSDYHPGSTHVLIAEREKDVDMIMEWKDIQNSFHFY